MVAISYKDTMKSKQRSSYLTLFLLEIAFTITIRKFTPVLYRNIEVQIFKQNKGLSSFTSERYPCMNKNFWWFLFF